MKNHQKAFNSGIVGPGMFDRTDTSKYQTGVSDAENTIVLPQGGMENRAGTKLAGGYDTSTGDGAQWLVPFEFSVDDTYMLEFSDAVMRVIKRGAYVLSTAIAGQSVTAVTAADPGKLTMANATAAGLFTVGRLVYFIDPNGTHALHQQVLAVTAIASATVSFTISDGTTVDTSAGVWGTIDAGALLYEVFEVASPYAIEDMSQVEFTQDVDTLYMASTAYDPQALLRIADDDWTFTAVTFEPSIAAPGSVAAAASTGSGSISYTYTVAAINGETGEESLPGTEDDITNDLTTVGNQNTVTWSTVTGADRYRVYKKSNGLFGFIGDTLATTFVDENIIADTAITPQQARDPFATASDRPKRVGFIEQRLTFAATFNNPQLVEMSNSQSPLNYNRAFSPVDDDAVTFRMRAQKLNRVTAIVPNDPHMIFTAGGEWTLQGGDQKGYIAPGNPIVRPLTYYGSAEYPKPLLIGTVALHVLNNGRHIREARPRKDVASAEVTILARHLFERRTIVSWAYAQHPDSVVWVTFDDGTLLTLTYLLEHEVWGWTKQALGGADTLVKQVEVVREDAVDVPYFVVERTLDGRTTTLVERLAPRDFAAVEDCYFVDCGFTYSGASTTTISGLLHLRGETVIALADGSVQEGLVVSGAGVVTLPFAAAKVQIGLSYEAYLITLGVDFGSALRSGSSRGSYKAASEVTVGVQETRGVAVGLPGKFLNEVKEYTGVTPIPLLTGLYTIPIEGDWQRDAKIEVRQKYPLPMTITGLAPDWVTEDD
jgi:hypothetical protein